MPEDEIVPSSSQLPEVPPAQQGIHRRPIQQQPATASVQSVSGVIGDIGDNKVTSRAEEILSATDEDMTWQERPSLALLIPRFLKYAVIMLLVMFLCSVVDRYAGPSLQQLAEDQGSKLHSSLQERDTRASRARRLAARRAKAARAAQEQAQSAQKAKEDQADANAANGTDTDNGADDDIIPVHHQAKVLIDIQYLVGLFLFLKLVWYLVQLLTTKYSASSQRLIVEEGGLHVINRPYELHQLGDAVISKPLITRMFGIGNLTIIKPPVVMVGLRNPEYVRDLIRQGGQLEAQRADKIRFR